MKKVWIETLLMAFPMNVDRKNTENGIYKCPQVKPATSNSGLGIYK
jgi:hypothetical protein